MKFVALAALTVLAAAPAVAADLPVSTAPVVRIALAGKTDTQVFAEIKDAAATVCRTAVGPCVDGAIRSANNQYASIKRSWARDAAAAQLSKLEVVREDRATVRVKIAGRSVEQINFDIDYAAKTVCRAVGAGDFRGCVDQATRHAKAQLREIASADRPAQVASR